MLVRLRDRLETLVDSLCDLIRGIRVVRFDRDSGGVIFIVPEYHWGEPTASQQAARLSLHREYDSLTQLLRLLLSNAPEDLVREFEQAEERFRVWLDLGSNWSLSPDADKNEGHVREALKGIEKILVVLDGAGEVGVIVIPDTNALLAEADPSVYRPIAQGKAFTFILLPTVLGELDRLKIEHRNPDVREKAKSVVRRIKGWRGQGSLSSGVKVDGTIKVRAVHEEPKMRETLPWLDRDNADDRIIASVLAVQAAHPAARVVLVSADINLLNKADAAMVEASEPPAERAS